jgi:hypothetical protein
MAIKRICDACGAAYDVSRCVKRGKRYYCPSARRNLRRSFGPAERPERRKGRCVHEVCNQHEDA